MSDKELIAEARGAFNPTNASASLIARLADALEARQPSEGDREAKAEALKEWQSSNEMRQYSEFYTSWEDGYEAGFSRAAAPDGQVIIPIARIHELRAAKDAALAAIERVRANHQIDDYTAGRTIVRCVCEEIWPCSTIQALDGVPEPDREAQLERVAARLREIVYLCGDDLGCQCEEAQDASADLAQELSIIAAERPTLTADEVWAIAKAEHDFAGDRDNVGAFVDSLTDALRTAGVAFDEQPFIDSGYLLPVEGEKP